MGVSAFQICFRIVHILSRSISHTLLPFSKFILAVAKFLYSILNDFYVTDLKRNKRNRVFMLSQTPMHPTQREINSKFSSSVCQSCQTVCAITIMTKILARIFGADVKLCFSISQAHLDLHTLEQSESRSGTGEFDC